MPSALWKNIVHLLTREAKMFDPIQIRHELHRIPELAFHENKTRDFILKQLRELCGTLGVKDLFEIIEFKNSTAILVVYQHGDIEDGFELFRADMDALPITESTGADFSSVHAGMMHACGHDVHMSVLMGLIQRVWIAKPKKNLLFLFQPAEEGEGGAQSVLREGILQNYDIRAAFALHVAGNMPVGTVSSKAGIFFGIPQEFDLRFLGKAAHVAFPEKGVNALVCGVDFMASIQAEINKTLKDERVIFHVGKMTAGRIRNVIADECLLQGTHRTLKQEVRDQLNDLIYQHANQIAERYHAKVEVRLLGSYDPVVNDPILLSRLEKHCKDLSYLFVPAETVMTGEDFGFFTSCYPGLLFWLGSGSDQTLHSELFLPADECIAVGIDIMWTLAVGMPVHKE